MDTMPGGNNTLRVAANAFLTNDLLAQPGIVPWNNANPWNQTSASYYACFRRIFTRVCGGCPYQSDNGQFNVILPIGGTQAQWNAAVAAVVLPNRITACLGDHLTKTVWMWGKIQYSAGPGLVQPSGHAVLVLLDKRARRQIVYDPDSGVDQPLSIVRAILSRQFHPRCLCETEANCTWPTLAVSTQQRCIGNILAVGLQGVCGLLSMVALSACLRFNFYNPKVIMDYITPQLANADTVARMIGWYHNILTHNWRMTALVQRVLPTSTVLLCRVYSPATRKLCSRKSCSVAPIGYTFRHMCWQHKALNINKRAQGPGSKTCAAPHILCIPYNGVA
ncbi:MAG: hypothetical protein WDW38_006569 [Sanguina aurantia]